MKKIFISFMVVLVSFASSFAMSDPFAYLDHKVKVKLEQIVDKFDMKLSSHSNEKKTKIYTRLVERIYKVADSIDNDNTQLKLWYVAGYIETSKLNGKIQDSEEVILNIDSKKVTCYGAFERECFIVDGEYFYGYIDGFDFEAGYEYKIKVLKEKFCTPGEIGTVDECPQDIGDNYTYTLVKIISKEKDNLQDYVEGGHYNLSDKKCKERKGAMTTDGNGLKVCIID